MYVENVPPGQREHAPEPLAGLNLPATHALHAPCKLGQRAHDSEYESLGLLTFSPCKMGKGAHDSEYELLGLLTLLELLILA